MESVGITHLMRGASSARMFSRRGTVQGRVLSFPLFSPCIKLKTRVASKKSVSRTQDQTLDRPIGLLPGTRSRPQVEAAPDHVVIGRGHRSRRAEAGEGRRVHLRSPPGRRTSSPHLQTHIYSRRCVMKATKYKPHMMRATKATGPKRKAATPSRPRHLSLPCLSLVVLSRQESLLSVALSVWLSRLLSLGLHLGG